MRAFSTLVSTDLSGYQMRPVRWLELRHDNCDSKPAIYVPSRKIILMASAGHVERISKLLPPSEFHERLIMMLIHLQSATGYNLCRLNEYGSADFEFSKCLPPQEILTQKMLSKIEEKPELIGWSTLT